MRRYGVRDDQWARIQDLLPGRVGHVGVTAKDNRLFVEAVLYRYRHRHPLARSARAVRLWGQGPHPLQPLGQGRRVGAGVPARGGRRRQRVRDDRLTIVRAHQHAAGAPKKLGLTRRSGAARAG
jgi:hypothetical protein